MAIVFILSVLLNLFQLPTPVFSVALKRYEYDPFSSTSRPSLSGWTYLLQRRPEVVLDGDESLGASSLLAGSYTAMPHPVLLGRRALLLALALALCGSRLKYRASGMTGQAFVCLLAPPSLACLICWRRGGFSSRPTAGQARRGRTERTGWKGLHDSRLGHC